MSEKTCFYCGAMVRKGTYELDHFPIPQECGGTETVVACLPCHDMKDRFSFYDLMMKFQPEFVADFERMGRMGRIMLAKCMRITAACGVGKEKQDAFVAALEAPTKRRPRLKKLTSAPPHSAGDQT